MISTCDDSFNPEINRFLAIYRDMAMARAIDQTEEECFAKGEASFHVSGRGHESSAVLAGHLGPQDYLHCHYRDKALLIARGVSPKSFLDSLFCNNDAHSRGRQMSAHMSDPALQVLSTVGPVGNNALQAVGVATETKHSIASPIVLCSVGDGTTQQGEFLEAISEAVRSQLRVLFWIEDNEFAISTRTAGKTFFDRPDGRPSSFYGIPILELDGTDVLACDKALKNVIPRMRVRCEPAIVLFKVARIANHTNADDQKVYRKKSEIENASLFSDPIKNLQQRLKNLGVHPETLASIDENVEQVVRDAATLSRTIPKPIPTTVAKRPLSVMSRNRKDVQPTNQHPLSKDNEPGQTMLTVMRNVLESMLANDSRVSIYGQDIEDPKGDVFGLTRGLSTSFPNRVNNSPLSESTIIGVSIGRGLAGGRPVACIQFADFLPLAWNQLATELGSMYWRTDGGWEAPVIVMVPCGGYRAGLGPFHAHTWESSLTHIPGIDVLMPSSADDAAGLLRAAFESGRPTVFLYPKICLNDPERATNANTETHVTPIGKARFLSRGDDLTIVTWGSTVPLCEQVVETLVQSNNENSTSLCSVELIDLRSLSPWDETTVINSVNRTRNLLVVHEDNLTCGFGAEIVAATVEQIDGRINCRRIARPDTYVPCNFDNQLEILPSYKSVLQASCELLSIDLSWRQECDSTAESTGATSTDNTFLVDAKGISPADQSVTVIDWRVKESERVEAGQIIGEAEADKAAFDIICPDAGSVEQILVQAGDTVRVGAPLLKVNRPSDTYTSDSRKESPIEKPIIGPCRSTSRLANQSANPYVLPQLSSGKLTRISRPYCMTGSVTLDNEQLAEHFKGRTANEIKRLTGIERRCQLSSDENLLDLAVKAVKLALDDECVRFQDVDAIVCSTSTPLSVSPSMACSLLRALSGTESREIPSHDVNAACTGYLYALGTAMDFLLAGEARNVLVVTADAMSNVIDPNDFNTRLLFGDAASATVLSKQQDTNPKTGREQRDRSCTRLLRRPVISALGDDRSALRVPFPGTGYVEMQGNRVFGQAVRKMETMLQKACADAGTRIEDLDWIVPHQANGRILRALRSRLPVKPERVFDAIGDTGNTSSTSIPLALQKLDSRIEAGQSIGLCAFGGGFTFGAAIVEVPTS